MTSALIVYGIRYRATITTSEAIARVLRSRGIDTKVSRARDVSGRDVEEGDLIVVGSGIRIDRWTGEADRFLARNRIELAKK